MSSLSISTILTELEQMDFPTRSSDDRATIVAQLNNPTLKHALDYEEKSEFEKAVGTYLCNKTQNIMWKRAVAWLHIFTDMDDLGYTYRLGMLSQLLLI